MNDFGYSPTEDENSATQPEVPALERKPHTEGICPVCGEKGKPVEGQTVKANLAVSLRAVRDVRYRFCRTATCPVVYFAPDGSQTFTREQVRVRVFQKEPEAPAVNICYCFAHTVGEIVTASPEKQRAILDDINTGIRAGQCACDLRNPQGACCLGNVRKVMESAKFGPQNTQG